MTAQRDTIDFGEIAGILRRSWRWVVGGTLAGMLLAVLVIVLVPPRFESKTTVLLRSGPEGAGSSLGAAARNAQSGFALGGLASVLSLASAFETEIEILTSRSVIEAVVDSLGLQAEVRRPRGASFGQLFSEARWNPDPPHRTRYRFHRESEGYRVTGPGASGIATPGVPFVAAGSTMTLREGDLPDVFEVRVFDRYEAVERTAKRMRASRAGGDVAEVKFRGRDRVTVAAVTNAVVAKYLDRRRTTDRGVNQRRYEFLDRHTDSIRVELARAEHALRTEQERSGVFDPEIFGKAELEQGLLLRAELEAAEVETRAIQQVLQQAATGTIAPRDLAAYPTFLQNPAVNHLLARLTALEAERTQLLDRRTERDTDVVILDRQIAQVEDQLVSVTTAYLDGLNRRRDQLRSELQRYTSVLATLPAHAESSYRAQREVRRLAETLVALGAELIQARLAAMAEGGDVRQIDEAIVSKRPAFPRPLLTLVLGIVVGIVGGAGGALGRSYLGSRVRERFHAELSAGVPVVNFDPDAPLLLRRSEPQRALLVLPIGAGARAGGVSRRIASTAALQGVSVVLADFEDTRAALPVPRETVEPEILGPGSGLPRVEEKAIASALRKEERADGGAYFVYKARANGNSEIGVHAAVQELEKRFTLVIVTLPGLTFPATAAVLGEGRTAVLVACAGRTRREELSESVAMLNQIGVTTAGVVLRHDGVHGDDSA